MKPILFPTLSTHHSHPRDKDINFVEETHKYTILTDASSIYTSVTTWNHSHFEHFDSDAIIKTMMKGKKWNPENKYWGMTPDEIKASWVANGKEVSEAGTMMHYQIECFMNNPNLPIGYTHQDLLDYYYLQPESQEIHSKEWVYFLEFVKNNPLLKPYRTEWIIYDETYKLAGSIDMLYENEDGTLMIYDWKRSRDIVKTNSWGKSAITDCISFLPDTNYWHYSLQLNTYKAILESKYNKKIDGMFLVKLHPANITKTFEILRLPILDREVNQLSEFKLSHNLINQNK
jgi:ATP-dependent exoDNAse (exonuclease V) beta subunit